MMPVENRPMFRPPAEASSLILQVTEGCPWNRCTFCGMYKRIPFRKRTPEELHALVQAEAADWPDARRVFLADGDPLLAPFDHSRSLLRVICSALPAVARINAYATGTALVNYTSEQWRLMRENRLHTLYMGLESGDPVTLETCRKQESVETMVEGCLRVQQAGLRVSVMVLLGLGGVAHSAEHVAGTIEALNRMQPRLLSFLRAIPIPGTEFHAAMGRGTFQPLTEYGAVLEMRQLLEGLDLKQTVFRADHSSNVLPLEGRLPRDRAALLEQIDLQLASGRLDRHTSGPMPIFL